MTSPVLCLDCGRRLRDLESRAARRGPVCRRKRRAAPLEAMLPGMPVDVDPDAAYVGPCDVWARRVVTIVPAGGVL